MEIRKIIFALFSLQFIDKIAAIEGGSSDLPANYTLPAPLCSFDETNLATVGDFKCSFAGINSPEDASISMQVLAYDCVAPYNKTKFGDTVVTPNTSNFTGETSFEAIADVNPSSGHEGDVKFCVRVDLLDKSDVVMMYRSEQAKLSFNYNGTFTVTGFATQPYVGQNSVVTSAEKNFGVAADVCDASGTVTSNPTALSLGTDLFVCIRTIVADTQIEAISNFEAKKSTGENFVIKTSSPNVVVRYLKTSQVQVVMRLPALFFENADDINLSGTVVVAPKSRRQLVIFRNLQSQTENADFGLVVPVNDINDEPFSRTYYGDSSTSSRSVMMYANLLGIFTLYLIM